jgi:hypothetical protein
MSHLFEIALAMYAMTLLIFAEGSAGKRSNIGLHRGVIQSRGSTSLQDMGVDQELHGKRLF